MKKYFILFLMLYVFGVVLRVVGQLINQESIKWKETLLLGELDGSQIDFKSKRYIARISVMLLLPFFFVKAVNK